jgi:UDP-N-acetylmuramate--alanine ligase
LTQMGLDPSYIIGGISKNLASNAHAGSGSYFVIEADEYDYMFLGLEPQYAVVLNMEHDHTDCYPTFESYTNAFTQFVNKTKPGGKLFLCHDQVETLILAEKVSPQVKVFTFGFASTADYNAKGTLSSDLAGYGFEVFYQGQKLCQVQLQVPGKHNVLNALAVLAVIHQAGLPLETAALALSTFKGTSRRFDILDDVRGITIINDYAHHPTEILTTLAAARDRYPNRRLWVVWQPHTYSRTRANLNLFIDALKGADRVVITEVYASREAIDPQFSARQIVEKMNREQVHFSPTLSEATQFLFQNLAGGDVLLVLSAGDGIQISTSLMELLRGTEVYNV